VKRKSPQIPTPSACHFRYHPKSRAGAATVETAVCLPFLLLLIFAGVEFANVVFLKQTLNLAAFEAAKSISSPGDNNSLALQSAARVMTSRRAPNYTISISPAVTQDTPRGTAITVTVTASASNLSFGPVSFMSGQNVSAVVRMARL
jgi:Flp pilus assembly protein TadG